MWSLSSHCGTTQPRALCLKKKSHIDLVRDSAGQHFGVHLAGSLTRPWAGARMAGGRLVHSGLHCGGWMAVRRVTGLPGLCASDPAAGRWGCHMTMTRLHERERPEAWSLLRPRPSMSLPLCSVDQSSSEDQPRFKGWGHRHRLRVHCRGPGHGRGSELEPLLLPNPALFFGLGDGDPPLNALPAHFLAAFAILCAPEALPCEGQGQNPAFRTLYIQSGPVIGHSRTISLIK